MRNEIYLVYSSFDKDI